MWIYKFLFLFTIYSHCYLWLIINGVCGQMPPPILRFDRNWIVNANEPIGSVVTRVQTIQNGRRTDSNMIYKLEPNQLLGNVLDMPFRIDNRTGVVYTNASLEHRAGENMMLYVTADNGGIMPPTKVEVWVNIVNSTDNSDRIKSNQPKPHQISNFFNNKNIQPPPMPVNFNINPSPIPSIAIVRPASNLPPGFNTSTTTIITTITTELNPMIFNLPNTRPHPPITRSNINQSIANTLTPPESTPFTVTTDRSEIAIKSLSDFKTIIIGVSVLCVMFILILFVLVLLKKKIYLGTIKSAKDIMNKESNNGNGVTTLNDEPTIAMQQWHGPQAFSNRYEPWERESRLTNPHNTANTQLSVNSIKKTDDWEYPRHRLKIFNILGEGAFGQVWRCEATDINGKEGITIVAVKTLKENASDKERSDLKAELDVMKHLEPHPNVVRLLGCCTDNGPLLVIMEYVARGKLQSYLRNSRAERYYGNMHGQSNTLTSKDLTSFVYQVARGMEYVASKNIVHRDLAARNVLITDEHTCKVADFGFARDISSTHLYERKSEGRLPIRWMAPESLYDNIFSAKSDVWSFGVFIWEVVTLGSTPYPGLSAADVMRKVRDGYRLDKPEHCRRELYNIMYYCWDKDPIQRPTFAECVALVEKLLLTETDYIELERFPDHSYYNMLSLSGEKL